MTSSFLFRPQPRPFRRWLGPFSPSRGTKAGFRFSGGRLGTWITRPFGLEFWPLVDSPASRQLAQLVLRYWGGGRVLLLPNGLIVKPLQGDLEVGVRVLIGGFRGPIRLVGPTESIFDLAEPGSLTPGDPWPGPTATGVECAIQTDGALDCVWYHPTSLGRDEVRARTCGPNSTLAAGFQRARPGEASGRVRVTANGHVITNRFIAGEWRTLYVGQIDTKGWAHEREWIGGRRI